MDDLRAVTCCFSGYRAEKMPFSADDSARTAALAARLDEAVSRAAAAGFRRFFTGMATGFDLWAAEAVLRARQSSEIQLLCAIPFEQQAQHFPPDWQRLFNRVLLAADQVFLLAQDYHSGCYAARNRFMIERSAHLICYYDGQPGGTAQTVRMARAAGLTIDNTAEMQLHL